MTRKKRFNGKRNPIQNKLRVRRHREINKHIVKKRSEIKNRPSIDCEYFDSSLESTVEVDQETILKQLLRSWVNCHGITTRAVNDLLQILRKSGTAKIYFLIIVPAEYEVDVIINSLIFKFVGVENLPKDYRTLLQTPKSIQIIPAAGGQYWYNGIERNLRLIFTKLDQDISIELNFNVDGLPIFKSSQRSFWPILANIHGKVTCSILFFNQFSLFRSVCFFIRHAKYSSNGNSDMVWGTKAK